jgi:formamidopyrimidine-DNA glycosylase
VLLDQKIVAGLGNIYVDEVLFAAGVRPMRLASELTKGEVTKIFQVIPQILTLSIKHRGTTFSNYVDSKGKRGNFSSLLQVYGRGKEKCLKCSSAIIKTKIAGRGTHYCPHCQK